MFFIYPLGLQTVGLGAWFNSHGEDTGDMGKEDTDDMFFYLFLRSPNRRGWAHGLCRTVGT